MRNSCVACVRSVGHSLGHITMCGRPQPLKGAGRDTREVGGGGTETGNIERYIARLPKRFHGLASRPTVEFPRASAPQARPELRSASAAVAVVVALSLGLGLGITSSRPGAMESPADAGAVGLHHSSSALGEREAIAAECGISAAPASPRTGFVHRTPRNAAVQVRDGRAVDHPQEDPMSLSSAERRNAARARFIASRARRRATDAAIAADTRRRDDVRALAASLRPVLEVRNVSQPAPQQVAIPVAWSEPQKPRDLRAEVRELADHLRPGWSPVRRSS
jgi:hypothetical protein